MCGAAIRNAARHTPMVIEEGSHGDATAQESQMFRNFANQVRSGNLNPAWPEMALKTQVVMEACWDSAIAQGRVA
jgi:hypothetical protein